MSIKVKDGVYAAYMKIAEPRIIRLLQFGIYILMLGYGLIVLHKTPPSLSTLDGHIFMLVYTLFLIIGAVCSAVAVLPGVWWLERSDLVLLGFGLLMYLGVVGWLNTSPFGLCLSAILVLSFTQRWLEIKGAQLAPLLPNKRG